MKCLILALVVAGVAATAQADERTVVIPTDTKPFSVELTDVVRLKGKGIAGTAIKVEITGPAKVDAESYIREVTNGATKIGISVKEFDMKPTEKGTVKVKITSTPPQPTAKPTVTEYEFEVK